MISGLAEIKESTKQSLREKPFSTAKGKIWTETPIDIPLKAIFTKLCWVKNCRTTHGKECEELSGITELLNEQQLGQTGPVRIVVEGKVSSKKLFSFGVVSRISREYWSFALSFKSLALGFLKCG